MGLFVLADSKQPSTSRNSCTYAAGGCIYPAGGNGLAWRVHSGVIRLDAPGSGNNCFASLAIASDVIGCESMLFGTYAFNATALTQCLLLPWPEGESAPTGDSLLHSLATAQKRAAEVVALRGGEALRRVVNLIRLLADTSGSVVLPMRQDIADITDLRFETISRIIKRLERDEVLAPVKICGVHATRSFSINMAGLAAV